VLDGRAARGRLHIRSTRREPDTDNRADCATHHRTHCGADFRTDGDARADIRTDGDARADGDAPTDTGANAPGDVRPADRD